MVRRGPTGATSSDTSPREIAAYLVGLRPVLASAMHGWTDWVKRIGILMEDVRHGNPGLVVRGAGRIGREQMVVFREARTRLELLRPPPACVECQTALLLWLGELIAACEVLIGVGTSGNVARVRDTGEHLANGRLYARRFNAEYARLADDLRQRVAAAAASRRPAARPRGPTRTAPIRWRAMA